MTTTTDTLVRIRHTTPFGELTLVASDAGLRAVLWPVERDGRVRLPPGIGDDADHPVLRASIEQLDQYVAGQRRGFDLPLDLHGTDLQRLVWEGLAGIPYGATRTYGEHAAQVGRPSAIRAVAAAIGRNPVSIVLPCHRVVGSDGGLTGFAGGLEAKRALLDHEGTVRTQDGAVTPHAGAAPRS